MVGGIGCVSKRALRRGYKVHRGVGTVGYSIGYKWVQMGKRTIEQLITINFLNEQIRLQKLGVAGYKPTTKPEFPGKKSNEHA